MKQPAENNDDENLDAFGNTLESDLSMEDVDLVIPIDDPLLNSETMLTPGTPETPGVVTNSGTVLTPETPGTPGVVLNSETMLTPETPGTPGVVTNSGTVLNSGTITNADVVTFDKHDVCELMKRITYKHPHRVHVKGLMNMIIGDCSKANILHVLSCIARITETTLTEILNANNDDIFIIFGKLNNTFHAGKVVDLRHHVEKNIVLCVKTKNVRGGVIHTAVRLAIEQAFFKGYGPGGLDLTRSIVSANYGLYRLEFVTTD